MTADSICAWPSFMPLPAFPCDFSLAGIEVQAAHWLLPEDTHFQGAYKHRLLSLIQERFPVTTEPEIPADCPPEEKGRRRLDHNEELFFPCYECVNNLSSRPLMFVAQYGLFRCLLTGFGLLTAVSVGLVICSVPASQATIGTFLLLAVLYGVLTRLSCQRCKARSEDFARTVFNLFVGRTAAKPTEDK